MTSADRLKEYENLFQKSQAYDTPRYQADFEKAYQEAANYNKDLIGQKSDYIAQAQALPSQLREQYYSSPIRNPLAQEALIDTRRGALTGDISRVVDLLQARGARYQDVLGKHLSAYESEAQRAATAAENAWRTYQDAIQQEQFNAQMRKSSGGGGGTSGFADLIAEILKGEKKETVTPQQQVLNAIDRVKSLRGASNIENKMNQYHQEIMNQARQLNLSIDPTALWQWLGNEVGRGPQTLILFR